MEWWVASLAANVGLRGEARALAASQSQLPGAPGESPGPSGVLKTAEQTPCHLAGHDWSCVESRFWEVCHHRFGHLQRGVTAHRSKLPMGPTSLRP